MGKPLGVGIVGVGNISTQYLENIPKLDNLCLIGVSDLNHQRAADIAEKHKIRAFNGDEIFQDQDIDVILNLTLPQSHTEVNLKALNAGKHVYLEKPFALSVNEGASILKLAEKSDLRVGCAPDTFLGTGIQTSKSLILDGEIGTPFAAAAFWGAPGHELWHPSPQFYYQNGAGPLFDMGPYYLTALVVLLGPVTRVVGSSIRSDRTRKVHSGDLADTPLTVEVDTHISALLTHASGAQSTITVSFETWGSRQPNIEVFGTQGTLNVPDPNKFCDSPQIYTESNREWVTVEERAGFRESGRGIGLSEMGTAISKGVSHRASGDLGMHVLEIMEAILKTGQSQFVVEINSTVEEVHLVPLT